MRNMRMGNIYNSTTSDTNDIILGAAMWLSLLWSLHTNPKIDTKL